jgi:hypothetical protein
VVKDLARAMMRSIRKRRLSPALCHLNATHAEGLARRPD